MAAQVAGSTTPVTVTSWWRCQTLRAAVVSGPKSPSATAPTSVWMGLTAGPFAPTPTDAHVVRAPGWELVDWALAPAADRPETARTVASPMAQRPERRVSMLLSLWPTVGMQ